MQMKNAFLILETFVKVRLFSGTYKSCNDKNELKSLLESYHFVMKLRYSV